MPQVNVLDMQGKVVGTIDLPDEVFGAEINMSAVHTVVKAYLANQRQGTQSTLTRAEVRGGGKKPWRQKGTGRARQGSTRSPQWFHGGVALGPKPRLYKISVNKKVKRLAMQSVLSSKVTEKELIVVDNIAFNDYKTKAMIEFLNKVGADGKALVVVREADNKVYKSASNIPGVTASPVNELNVYNVLKYDKLVVSKDAVMMIGEVYA